MSTQVFNDRFVSTRILPENVLDYNYDLFDDILSGNFHSNQLVESQDAPFSSLVKFNGDDSNCRDGFPCEFDVNFLRVIFQLSEKLVDILHVRQANHQFQLGDFEVERILEVAKEDPHFSIENVRMAHEDQIYVPRRNILNLWHIVHQ